MDLTIKKLKKEKTIYKVELSNGASCKFLPEIVSSYNLSDGMVLDYEKLGKIIAQNSTQSCFNELLKILSRRPHTTFEIKTKLFNKGFKSLIISAAIEKASELKLLNDKSTAEIYMSELSNKGYGKYKIIQAMKKKGIESDLIMDLTFNLCQNDQEAERARDIFYKKLNFLKKNKFLTGQKIKERLFRFMQSKGFSNDIILRLLEEISSKTEDY